jgi:hypothetical protein
MAARRVLTTGAAALALALALPAAPAIAQGLRRLDGAWLVPERLAGAALSRGAAIQPGAAIPANGLWVRAGQARLHGLAELPVRRLAIGATGSGGAWSLEGGWESLGSALLRDDVVEVRLQAGRRWGAGLSGRWRRLQAGQAAAWRAFDGALDLGLAWSDRRLGSGAVRFFWPLRAPDTAPGAEPVPRLLLAIAGGGRALALLVDAGPDGRPHAGWEALCALTPGVGLCWRADPASGALGGGLRLERGWWRLRTSHLVHPDLGPTHRCELAFGAVGASPW